MIKDVVHLHHAAPSLNSKCLSANPGEGWRCFFANYSYAYSSSPTFLIQSAYDNYQLSNVLPGSFSTDCTHYCKKTNSGLVDSSECPVDFESCTVEEVHKLNEFKDQMME